MDLHDTHQTYRLFSVYYDLVFGPVFHPGRKEAVRIANDRPGQHILGAGVGTGLSLPHFRPDSRVTGIDVSTEMLAKAKRRAKRLQLAHVEGLHVMDAENLEFPDSSFDAVLALGGAGAGPNPPPFRLSCRFSVRRFPPRQPAVDPRGAAEQSVRLLEAVVLRQRKAGIEPGVVD